MIADDNNASPCVPNKRVEGPELTAASSSLRMLCSQCSMIQQQPQTDDEDELIDQMILDALEEEAEVAPPPTRRRRLVHFARRPPEIIPSSLSCCRQIGEEEEKEEEEVSVSLWYTPQELKQFRNGARLLCQEFIRRRQQRNPQQNQQRQKRNSNNPHGKSEFPDTNEVPETEATLPPRGFELKLSFARQSIKFHLIQSVVAQQHYFSNDPQQRLADLSILLSRRATRAARHEAARDFFRAYYDELDPVQGVRRLLVGYHQTTLEPDNLSHEKRRGSESTTTSRTVASQSATKEERETTK